MDLDTKWLRDFIALSQTRSFSSAAQIRHITQPAFSRRIKSLEQQLNTKLVCRLTNPLSLTKQGESFLAYADLTIKNLDQHVSLLHNLNQQIETTFAATHTLSLGVFPTIAALLNNNLENIDTQLQTADADDCVKKLTKKQCDFLIAFRDPLLRKYEKNSHLLSTVKLLPVCKPNDDGTPLYSLKQQPNAVPCLAYQDNIYLGRVVNQLIKKNKAINIKKSLTAPMADSLKMMAIKGLGIAWIPEFSIQQELETGELVIAGNKSWQPNLEVRVYHSNTDNPQLNKVWQILSTMTI